MKFIEFDEDNEATKEKSHLSGTAKIIIAIIAAGLILMCSIITFALPVSYVTLDVNPSIEYSLNLIGDVIGLRALNEDARDILSSLKSSGIHKGPISKVIPSSVDTLKEGNYLSENDNYILLSVTSKNANTSADIWEKINNSLSSYQEDGLTCKIVKGTRADRRVALSISMSTGRYKMMLDANDDMVPSDPSIIEAYKIMSIKEMLGAEDITEETEDEPEESLEPEEETSDDTILPDEPAGTEDNTATTPSTSTTTVPSGNQGSTGNTGGQSGGWTPSPTPSAGNGGTGNTDSSTSDQPSETPDEPTDDTSTDNETTKPDPTPEKTEESDQKPDSGSTDEPAPAPAPAPAPEPTDSGSDDGDSEAPAPKGLDEE